MIDKEQLENQKKIIVKLLSQYKSLREFARTITEDPTDVVKWRDGKRRVHPRAVMTIARLFKIEPQELRPDLFDQNTKITFTEEKKK